MRVSATIFSQNDFLLLNYSPTRCLDYKVVATAASGRLTGAVHNWVSISNHAMVNL